VKARRAFFVIEKVVLYFLGERKAYRPSVKKSVGRMLRIAVAQRVQCAYRIGDSASVGYFKFIGGSRNSMDSAFCSTPSGPR
jgi:hypothetical protein